MSERFSRLYTFDSKMHQTDAPVIISAGALLKDSVKDAVIAQIKFQNISDKTINNLTVHVQQYSFSEEKLGDEVKHQYLDLSAKRDEEFGQKEGITLPDNSTRLFEVRISEVVFEDKTIWQAETFECEKIDSPRSFETAYPDDQELIRQFALDFGNKSKYMPESYNGIWRCTCAAINRNDEQTCHVCGNDKSSMLPFDLKALNERKKDRIYNEALALIKEDTLDSLFQARLKMESLSEWKDSGVKISEIDKRTEELKEEDRKKAAAEEEKKQNELKKKKKMMVFAAGIILALAALAFLIVGVIIPGNHVKKGDQYLSEEKYDEAIKEYESAKNEEKIHEAKYQQALHLIENDKNYSDALVILEGIEGYKDSSELIPECKYQNAGLLLESKQYESASQLYLDLSNINYKDSNEKYQEAKRLSYLGNFDDLVSQAKQESDLNTIIGKLRGLKSSDLSESYKNIDDQIVTLSEAVYNSHNYCLFKDYYDLISDDALINENETIQKLYILSFFRDFSDQGKIAEEIIFSLPEVTNSELNDLFPGEYNEYKGTDKEGGFDVFRENGEVGGSLHSIGGSTVTRPKWHISGDKLYISQPAIIGAPFQEYSVKKIDDKHYILTYANRYTDKLSVGVLLSRDMINDEGVDTKLND